MIPRYEAVKFFTETARIAHPGFSVTEENAQDVAQIIQILEGSPWAMQMVASRLGVLSPQQILTRLKDDPLALLVDRNPETGALSAALSSVLTTLNPWSQALFKRLWIFQGPFTLESVEDVCSDDTIPKSAIFSSLKDLLDVQLLKPTSLGHSKRTFILGSIGREFSESLSTSQDRKLLQGRISVYLRRRGAQLFENGLTSEKTGLQEFETLYEDFRYRWLKNSGSKVAIHEVVSEVTRCGSFWLQKMYFQEGLEILGYVSSQRSAPSAPKFLTLLNLIAWCHLKLGDNVRARVILKSAIRIAFGADDRPQIARLLNTCSAVFSNLDRCRSAIRMSRYSIALLDRSDPVIALMLVNLAGLLAHVKRFDEAEMVLCEVSNLKGQAKSWSDVMFVANTALVKAGQGRFKEAIAHLLLACDLLEEFPYEEIIPGLYLTGCVIFIEGGRLYSAAVLLKAVEEMNERNGFLCPPRRKNLMDRFEKIVGNDLATTSSGWDLKQPLHLLQESLMHW